MKGHFWTADRDTALAAQIAKGVSATEAAAILGGSRNALLGRAMRLGLQFTSRRDYRSSWTKPRDARMHELLAKGLTHEEVGEELGVTCGAVMSRVKKLRSAAGVRHIPKPKLHKVTADERAQLLASLEATEGVLIEDITDKQCAYAITDTLPFRFCGRERGGKSRYCKDHNLIVHQQVHLARL